MNKVLTGIQHHDAYTRLVEREIISWLQEAVFQPLTDMLEQHGIATEHLNATESAVEAALNAGTLHYTDGAFTGQLEAGVSRELQQMGATWDSTGKRFLIPIERVPYALRGAIAASTALARETHESAIGLLTTIEANVAAAQVGLRLGSALDAIMRDLQKQYVRQVTGIETVGVKQEIDEFQRVQLDQMLTNNLELSIKDFSADMIPALRRDVEKNLLNGARTDRLADLIKSKYGVSQRKAEFLADQETGMLTAKFAQIQAKEIGSTEYIWSTSHDERVRPDHQALDGKRFSYDSPPITNRATGARNNPGEDFRCRCVAKPIVNLPSE